VSYNKFDNGFEKGSKALLNGGKKAGRKLGNAIGRTLGLGIRRGGRKLLKSTVKSVGKMLSLLPKQVVVILAIFIFVLISFTSCGYFATLENVGETGNRIDNSNSGSYSVSENSVVYSNANANCIAYYKLLSKEKSVWQESIDENGNKILIRADDKNAVSDYFKNDLNYYVDADLLFCMNKYIFGEEFVYPEAFLQPVNYNKETFELIPLTTEDGNVSSVSKKYNKDGTVLESESQYTTSDYGIATVMSYTKQTEKTSFKGTYYKKEVLNNDGTISEIDIDEEFDITIKTKEYDILDKVVTFAGNIQYNYIPSSTLTATVKTGESSGVETDLTEIYVYANTSISFVTYKRVLKDKDGNEVTGISLGSEYPYNKRFMKYNSSVDAGYTDDYISEWISLHTKEIEYTDSSGSTISLNVSYEYSTESIKQCSLKKYRTSDSGIYIDFVNQSETICNDLGNGYLYDYLKHFSCYFPANLSRSYNTFLQMGSQATDIDSIIITNYEVISGLGTNSFEQIYNGSEEGKELLELIWDILITWGYSEVQASAVIGNMGQESGYNPSVVNNIGAVGLCQWLNDRKTNLFNFAGSIQREWTDAEIQVIYACMELSVDKLYDQCSYQWGGYEEEAEIFANSTDLAEVTKAICRGWERCGNDEANYTHRIACANSAYATFSGRVPETQALIIAPSGSTDGNIIKTYDTSYVTRSMSDKDKELFNVFYHSVDDIYNGNYILEFKTKCMAESEIDNMLLLANSYINGTSLDEERINSVNELWSTDYISNLTSKKTTVADVYGVDSLGEPRLSVENIEGMPYWFSGSPFYNSGYGLPNCTTWVYGRCWEATGEQPPSIFLGDAKTWWTENINTNTYLYGSEPKAGAIMVWGGNGAGHVAFVEQVNTDGTMTITQSGWKTMAWYPYNVKTGTVESIENYSSSRPFLGYIYMEKIN